MTYHPIKIDDTLSVIVDEKAEIKDDDPTHGGDKILYTIGSRRIEGVPQLEIEDDEIKELAEISRQEGHYTNKYVTGFIAGYKAAHNKDKVYTEQQVKQVIYDVLDNDFVHTIKSRSDYSKVADEFIKNLNPPKEIESIEIESGKILNVKYK